MTNIEIINSSNTTTIDFVDDLVLTLSPLRKYRTTLPIIKHVNKAITLASIPIAIIEKLIIIKTKCVYWK